MKDNAERLVVGWREWLALPDLGLPAIKAKIDTGARTSALHAFFVEPFDKGGVGHVRFGIHPLQRRTDIEVVCEAPVVDRRWVSDSGGHRELRYFLEALVHMGGRVWPVEISLTDRDSMMFRMLLGRTAIKGRMMVDPERSYVAGKLSRKAYFRAAKRRERRKA
ncbi:MAG: ATP-dependent zinc protease [Proteobacteria bacterium]|nr:ATP-dependent zinc protease [Pseudomonadota bacterium]